MHANEKLHSAAQTAASQERESLIRVLRVLNQIEQTKAYLERKCASLHRYCCQELRYSEAAASRRVYASRQLAETPELANTLASGELNLSVLCLAGNYIKHEERRTKQKLTSAQKLATYQALENKSQAESEIYLSTAFPHAKPPKNKVRKLKDGGEELTLTLSKEGAANRQRVLEINSHKTEFHTPTGMFEALLREHLKRNAPENKTGRQKPSTSQNPRRQPTHDELRQLHEQANSQCEHIHRDGTRCTERLFLQTDHIEAVAHGGGAGLDNWQLLCAAHNRSKGCH